MGVQPSKLSASCMADASILMVCPTLKSPLSSGGPVGVLLGARGISASPYFLPHGGSSFHEPALDLHPTLVESKMISP